MNLRLVFKYLSTLRGGGSQSGHLELRNMATATNSASSSTPHKKAQGSQPVTQATTVRTTDDLNMESQENATFILPHLQVVTPEIFMKENFGKAAFRSMPADFNPKQMQLSPKPSNRKHRLENTMWPELVSIYHPDGFLG